jgi:hypothetical protein
LISNLVGGNFITRIPLSSTILDMAKLKYGPKRPNFEIMFPQVDLQQKEKSKLEEAQK